MPAGPTLETLIGPVAAATVALAAVQVSHAAGTMQCPEDRGIYQAVASPAQELAFAGERGTLTLRAGKVRLVYPFTVTHSNGFSITRVNVTGKEAPSSSVSSFNSDFSPYRGEGSAPFIVTPDLPVGFYYFDPFRSRADFMDLLPGEAWRLVRCSGGR